MNKYLSVLLLAAAAVLGFHLGAPRRQQVAQLRGDREALLAQARHYRLRDSLSAASVAVLTLKSDELELHFRQLSGLLHELNLKARSVESISQAALETSHTFSAPLRDTLLLADTVQAVRFDDGHIRLEGIMFGEEFRGAILSRDTLTQVVHRIPRHFLFLHYGTKALRQEIVSSNPHTAITYSRYIRIEK